MPNQFRSLDRIKIEAPCEADWDSMIGNDKVRFCQHCNLHVNNLSAITRSQAQRLVARSSGRLCARYVVRPDGGVVTKPSPKNLYRISRRVSRLAAGAFTATLSLASAAAQTRSTAEALPIPQITQPKAADKMSTGEGTASLSGTVTDPTGAVVQGATVTLINSAEHATFNMTTNETGAYSFSFLNPGVYTVTAEGGGLAKNELPNLNLKAQDAQSIDLRLDLPLILAQVEIIAAELENSIQGGAMFVAPEEPLVKAAAENDLATVRQLVFSSSNINVQDKHTDMTALDHAVENGNYEITRTLLAAGANVRNKNARKRTALMYLRENATVGLVRELLAAGAKVNDHDDDGETVLMKAVTESSVAVVRVLTEAGTKIDATNEDGKTALMFAVSNVDPQVAKLLIDLGAEVNAKNDDGETALIIAAEDGTAATVKALIAAGAEVNAKDDQGFTALINAAAEGNLESVKLLLKAGADLSARDENQRTALGLARKFEHGEVVEFLKTLGAPE
jgi:ankyrin repeat protein